MPTDLERAGDYSQSRDVNNALITIRDPQNGQVFPGNRRPASRLDPSGVALLKAFDAPNFPIFDANDAIAGSGFGLVSSADSPRMVQLGLRLTF